MGWKGGMGWNGGKVNFTLLPFLPILPFTLFDKEHLAVRRERPQAVRHHQLEFVHHVP